MGCFQSRTAEKRAQAAAAHLQAVARREVAERNAKKALGLTHAQEDTASGSASEQPGPERPKSEVLKQAGAFDELDARARSVPELEVVDVVEVGERNAAVLRTFEEREREARAPPVLRQIETVSRGSKIVDTLRDFELSEARVRAEPKLHKTFNQRQSELAAASA